MNVLLHCLQLCPDRLPVETDVCLGDGADGEVFTIVGDRNKVIKLGIFYDCNEVPFFEHYREIKKSLDWLIVNQPQAYARVYEHGHLMYASRKVESGLQMFVMYYYIMEKLQKTTEDERKVFHSILSHEDRGIEKNFSPEKLREMLIGMGSGLDFDAEQVTIFCNNIKSTPLSHLDIHVRNIMKDATGMFKLIDLDRIKLENENAKGKD